jgi:hypothetical protein
MLLPPMIKTEAPFSNLISPSTSPVSRFNYKKRKVIKYKYLKNKKYLDTVVHMNIWVGISDSSSIMGDNKRYFVGTHRLFLNLTEFEATLFLINLVGLVSSLDIIKDSEKLSSLFNTNYIHDAKWESWVSPDLVINLDISILIFNNNSDFLSCHGISQSVLQEYTKGNAFSCLMWPC